MWGVDVVGIKNVFYPSSASLGQLLLLSARAYVAIPATTEPSTSRVSPGIATRYSLDHARNRITSTGAGARPLSCVAHTTATRAPRQPHDGVDNHRDQYARTMPYRAIAHATMTNPHALDVLEVPATTTTPVRTRSGRYAP